MSTRVSRGEGQAGFSLVEILVALAIVAALGTLVVPALRLPAQARLRGDAQHLVAALRITRAAAMAQNRDLVLVLDPVHRTFGSPVVPERTFDARTEIAVEGAPELRSGAVDGIRFLANGRSTGGAIQLEQGAFRTRVRVVWATGHVIVED